jgi:hypothetical protein
VGDVEGHEVEHVSHIDGLISAGLHQVHEPVYVLRNDRFLGAEVGGGEGMRDITSTMSKSLVSLHRDVEEREDEIREENIP